MPSAPDCPPFRRPPPSLPSLGSRRRRRGPARSPVRARLVSTRSEKWCGGGGAWQYALQVPPHVRPRAARSRDTYIALPPSPTPTPQPKRAQHEPPCCARELRSVWRSGRPEQFFPARRHSARMQSPGSSRRVDVVVVAETTGLLGAAPERSAAYGRADGKEGTRFSVAGLNAALNALLAGPARQRLYAGAPSRACAHLARPAGGPLQGGLQRHRRPPPAADHWPPARPPLAAHRLSLPAAHASRPPPTPPQAWRPRCCWWRCWLLASASRSTAPPTRRQQTRWTPRPRPPRSPRGAWRRRRRRRRTPRRRSTCARRPAAPRNGSSRFSRSGTGAAAAPPARRVRRR